jgi:hypothetical protein
MWVNCHASAATMAKASSMQLYLGIVLLCLACMGIYSFFASPDQLVDAIPMSETIRTAVDDRAVEPTRKPVSQMVLSDFRRNKAQASHPQAQPSQLPALIPKHPAVQQQPSVNAEPVIREGASSAIAARPSSNLDALNPLPCDGTVTRQPSPPLFQRQFTPFMVSSGHFIDAGCMSLKQCQDLTMAKPSADGYYFKADASQCWLVQEPHHPSALVKKADPNQHRPSGCRYVQLKPGRVADIMMHGLVTGNADQAQYNVLNNATAVKAAVNLCKSKEGSLVVLVSRRQALGVEHMTSWIPS